MRTAYVALGLTLAVSSCGYLDAEESTDDTGTGQIESASTTAAPPTTTKKQAQRAATRAERRAQAFIDSCVEYVPTMALLGEEVSTLLWAEAGQKVPALRASCTQIANRRPKQRTLLEQMMLEAEAYLAERAPSTTVKKKSDRADEDAGDSATTTTVAGATTGAVASTVPATTAAAATTLAPTTSPVEPAQQNAISISCPPHERQAGTVFRAQFSVSTSGESAVVEWGISYGDGQSNTASSRSVADSQLYWHDYLGQGTYSVTAWIVDEYGRRSSDTCTAIWTDS